MKENRKPNGRAMSMPAGIALGILVSLGITVLGAAVLAYLISRETIRDDGIGYGSLLILILGTLAGTLTAVTRVKRRRMQVSAITGGGYFLSLLGMNALLFDGQYDGLGTTALLVMIGVLITAFWRAGGEKMHKYGRKKVAHG